MRSGSRQSRGGAGPAGHRDAAEARPGGSDHDPGRGQEAAEGPGGALPGALVICPTPIGNLEDVTLRVLGELRRADVIACEDTRRTRRLLERHGITPRSVVSYHEHNEARRAVELARRIGAGDRVALVSDAGMPLVSDPGYLLLRACIDRELPVEVLPGASAPLVALVASGLPPARWCFVGFLPRKRGERLRIFECERHTVVAFESPLRLARALAEIAESDPEREVAVCRELSKLHEEVRRGTASELAGHFSGRRVRGEIVLVIAGAPEKKEARPRR